ncbi:hypothetical protein ACTTAI_03750 [Rhodobacter capsulatus]|uniref:hypothetical protein n=1 Tax=Rhodobacter capsulatus TaxID=1061 RepID=UPI00402A04C8
MAGLSLCPYRLSVAAPGFNVWLIGQSPPVFTLLRRKLGKNAVSPLRDGRISAS